MKSFGFLSFGHYDSGSDLDAGQMLRDAVDISVGADELGVNGAYFRVHHFASQAASPIPLLSTIAAKTRTIEVGTGVIDMRYKYPAGPDRTGPNTNDGHGVDEPQANRDVSIDVRVTKAEREAVRRRARRLGVKPSKWVRTVILDALDSRRDGLGHLEVGWPPRRRRSWVRWSSRCAESGST